MHDKPLPQSVSASQGFNQLVLPPEFSAADPPQACKHPKLRVRQMAIRIHVCISMSSHYSST
jgi:hypothetical protein